MLMVPCSPHAVALLVVARLLARGEPCSPAAVVRGEEPHTLILWVPGANTLLLSMTTCYKLAPLCPWLGMAPLHLQEMHGRASQWEEGKKEDDKRVPHVIVY
jgi:hypothetical protein